MLAHIAGIHDSLLFGVHDSTSEFDRLVRDLMREMRGTAAAVPPRELCLWLRAKEPRKFEANKQQDASECLEIILNLMSGSLQQIWQAGSKTDENILQTLKQMLIL
eukprot:Skav210040  [mRNA]  locus=scaffold706:160481:160798:+ [translate_table: standard]